MATDNRDGMVFPLSSDPDARIFRLAVSVKRIGVCPGSPTIGFGIPLRLVLFEQEASDGGPMRSEMEAELARLLGEARERFGAVCLWYMDSEQMIDPTNADQIARALRHGPRDAWLLARKIDEQQKKIHADQRSS